MESMHSKKVSAFPSPIYALRVCLIVLGDKLVKHMKERHTFVSGRRRIPVGRRSSVSWFFIVFY